MTQVLPHNKVIFQVICSVQNQTQYLVYIISYAFTVDDKGLPILNIDHGAVSYYRGAGFPTSTCATPCALHQVKIQVGPSYILLMHK